MSEENQENLENKEQEWEAPPIPEQIEAEAEETPEMSEMGTIANVFIEPGRTFEDLRRKPRYIIAFVLIALASLGFALAFQQKMGEDRIRRFISAQQARSPQIQAASEEQKENALNLTMTIQRVTTYALPVLLLIAFLIGSLIYWLGSKAMGGSARFSQAFSVFVYSSLPPTLVSQFANFIIMLLKPADEIDIAASQRGLVSANPTLFFDGKEMPVLTTLISTIDVFVIWGLVLAALGLHKVAKISKGSAWGVVLILFLLGLTARVISAFLNGIPS